MEMTSEKRGLDTIISIANNLHQVKERDGVMKDEEWRVAA